MKRQLVFLAVALATGGAAQAACSEADKRALEAFDRAWSEAGAAADLARLDGIYSDHYGNLTAGAPMDKAGELAAVKAEGPAAADEPVPVSDFYVIACHGDSAVISHRNVLRSAPDKPAGYSRSIHHMVREGGRWRVLANATHRLHDADVVRYLDLEWNLAELAADKAWFERNLADDYLGISSRDGKPQDKQEMLAEVGTYRVTQAESTDLEVDVDGDHALASGIFHVSGTGPDGQAFSRKVRYVDHFVRRDGRWQVWSSQSTAIPD